MRTDFDMNDEEDEEEDDFDGEDEEDALDEEEDGGDMMDVDEEDDDDEEDEEGEDESSEDEDIGASRNHIQDDLFADAEDIEEGSSSEAVTAHEKRMAALRSQIAELETQNVSKKDWVLMGEASSRTRPHNSVLEEDLEFERLMKAVPVITEEVVLGLEEKIKARIKDGNFDDVVRRREVEDRPFLPSRMFELHDSKSEQSLAQIYEDEYTKAQSGGKAGGDDRDGKLKKEHDEIDIMWNGICAKLDALCNAHFIPKQVCPQKCLLYFADKFICSLKQR